MGKLRGRLLMLCNIMASFILLVGISSADIACMWWFHQPKVPEGIGKLRDDVKNSVNVKK